MKKIIFLILILGVFSRNAFSQTTLLQEYNLLPWPKEITKNSAKFIINSGVAVSIMGDDSQERVRNATVNFLRRLVTRTGIFIEEGFPVANDRGNIKITFNSVAELNIQTDESYQLHVSDKEIRIHAKTDVGAIRALNTLLQLITHDATDYYFQGADINDAPRFVWRGLMIDVSRHFHPIGVIKRNLEAMASVKMNVFHWHLTDDQGFRVESKVYPKLHQLASDGLYYTQEQIKDVVAYANKLGIRVIPEFDVPGHASAILTAYPELGSKDGYHYAIERFSGVFDPTLDPTKDITYTFLENLFSEMVPLFPDTYFHIGGDENEGKHWDENEEIQKFKKQHNLTSNHDLQTYFNIRLEEILNKLGKKLMGWDEIMTPNMPTTAVIHSWRGENEGLPKGGSLISAAKQGYQTVLSNGYYIDRMLSIKHHYTVDPIGDVVLTPEQRARVLGGEATMWSELVTPRTIDSRIWPRTAAIAERFWSAQSVNDIDNMLSRLKTVSFDLEELGITHIRNKAVILRSMTHNQDIKSLEVLSKICEPLKIYKRNKDGVEYKTFSPFSLFADACVVDAEDALKFNNLVSQFIADGGMEVQNALLDYLSIWSNNHEEFRKLDLNPKTKPLENLSLNVSEVSGLLFEIFQNREVSKKTISEINQYIEALKQPVEDVEVVILRDLNYLLNYAEENFKVSE
ncbi:beta-N-acetylhexosaminidase [Gaetbulibacter saemankumensis]|uniref:beta-N-acetylhexosaminidase n=1 Tax=Gaetbulibacter saemankumensis TaxID=311208 RepID=UPI0003F99078|nr:family 20 glycosylhydrolase [Gaetbulibacter saemankumensis]